ncbi:MAG TPA: hypothetical protein VHG29_08070 [Novosphingobium sp.]|nr:hypothetical protein [Novosphingobium sp.]
MTTTTNSFAKPKSKLDKAVIASVAAMTIFVLAQQLQPVPVLAAANGAVAAQQA